MSWFDDLTERTVALMGEVAYGSTKELVRVVLASCVAVLMTNPRRGGIAERLKVAGALLLLALAVYLLALRFLWLRHGVDEPPAIYMVMPWLKPSPPPPPPPVTMLVQAGQDAAKRVLAYSAAHPLQVAGTVGALLLADLLNIAITIDRLDPLVRLASTIGRPFNLLFRYIWRLVVHQRRRAALQAAVRSAAPNRIRRLLARVVR